MMKRLPVLLAALTIVVTGCAGSTNKPEPKVAQTTTSAGPKRSRQPKGPAPTTDRLTAVATKIGCDEVKPGNGDVPGVKIWGTCDTDGGPVMIYLASDVELFLDDVEAFGANMDMLFVEGNLVIRPDNPVQLEAIRKALEAAPEGVLS